jgi:hypothetical protein
VSIGKVLAEARRGAGLTVAQVSQRTRIREAIITRIEGDDYSACGGDFYARGHIRAIARAAGADPEPLIRAYDTARRVPPLPEDVTEPITPLREYGTAPRAPLALPADVTGPVTPVRVHERRQPIWTAALGLALAVALGFVAYHFLAGSRQAASAPTARAHPATHHHASHGTLAPETTPAPKMTVASAASAGGRIRLRLATPAHGRYVLIWFTRLPPDPGRHLPA